MNIIEYLQLTNPARIGHDLLYLLFWAAVTVLIIIIFYFARIGFISWFVAEWNRQKRFEVMKFGADEYCIYSHRHNAAVLGPDDNPLTFKSREAGEKYLKERVLKYGI